jgi:hypothetical protein
VAAADDDELIWCPLATLPELADLVDRQLTAAEKYHQILWEARRQPGSLDDAAIERVVRVYTEEIRLLDMYDEQLARWTAGPLTAEQRGEIARLGVQVTRNREVTTSILALAEELRGLTVRAILGKWGLELGGEFLLGGLPASAVGPRDGDTFPGYAC